MSISRELPTGSPHYKDQWQKMNFISSERRISDPPPPPPTSPLSLHICDNFDNTNLSFWGNNRLGYKKAIFRGERKAE
jgi:hypothetical protein